MQAPPRRVLYPVLAVVVLAALAGLYMFEGLPIPFLDQYISPKPQVAVARPRPAAVPKPVVPVKPGAPTPANAPAVPPQAAAPGKAAAIAPASAKPQAAVVPAAKPQPPVAAAPAPVNPQAAASVKPSPNGAAPDADLAPAGYTYDPAGRRDPFVSLLTRAGVSGQRGGLGARPAGLGGLETGEVTLRGTLLSQGAYVGIVQGSDNKTYIVKSGDRLLDGEIRSITPDTMVIMQQVTDPLSLEKQREVRKLLRPTEEAK